MVWGGRVRGEVCDPLRGYKGHVGASSPFSPHSCCLQGGSHLVSLPPSPHSLVSHFPFFPLNSLTHSLTHSPLLLLSLPLICSLCSQSTYSPAPLLSPPCVLSYPLHSQLILPIFSSFPLRLRHLRLLSLTLSPRPLFPLSALLSLSLSLSLSMYPFINLRCKCLLK